MPLSSVRIVPGCTLCGICEQICPEGFEMGAESAALRPGIDLSQYEEKIIEASDGCPVQVIEVNR
ncbi:MAG: ferredoxin [Candidatus Margulisbacteria bacterium]|nr:ferredoxin [Candidatus Margulisiibacteriota bacterium]